METICEDYCSYELSKLLKEKGFDGECVGCYWDSKKTFSVNYEPSRYSDGDLRDEVILAPTPQMARKWLLKKHELFICIEQALDSGGDVIYVPTVWKNAFYLERACWDKDAVFKRYEDAEEVSLFYCLTNLI